MQSMKKLRSLHLLDYQGVSLPSYICQFQNLKNFHLKRCMKLKEIPALDIGNQAAHGGFPMSNAKTMLQLQILKIQGCRVLKTFRVEELPNLRKLGISHCAELKELSMESGGGLLRLERLDLWSLQRLESIVWNAKTMLQIQFFGISNCHVLKTFGVEELPSLKEINISNCVELKESFMESGGSLPMLEILELYSLEIRSIVWNEKTMLQLQSFYISYCRVLKTFRVEELPNLKEIEIKQCPELQVQIGSVPMLKKLTLEGLKKSESIARASSVWNKETMPKLEYINITGCPLLRRLPMEMDKLPNLKKIVGEVGWWEGINWEIDNVKIKLSELFRDEDEDD